MSPRDRRRSGITLPVSLQSGGVSLEILDDGSVREVRVSGRPALDGVYLAVRDELWGTARIDVETASWTMDEHTFLLDVTSRHRNEHVDMRWRTRVEGAGDHISIVADGTFLRRQSVNRAGFAVLHPLALEGRPVTIATDYGVVEGRFPARISPDQLFTGVTAMVEDLGDGASLAIKFEGEPFETEDHRNWTDAGWKTYCTPLALPAPVLREAGTEIRQSITLTARGASAEPSPPPVPFLSVGDLPFARMPNIGYLASGLGAARPSTERLVRLGASHLEVDLRDSHLTTSALEDAADEARALPKLPFG